MRREDGRVDAAAAVSARASTGARARWSADSERDDRLSQAIVVDLDFFRPVRLAQANQGAR